jgi:hypothetical protein
MNELDQAPASGGQGSATDVTHREPAGDQHAGGYDSQAQSPRAESPADADPSYYDGDIQAALAADDTPTRQEAARQDAAGEGHDSPVDSTRRDSDADIDAILHQDDDLPDPRTRQQAAADDLAGGAPGNDSANTSREDLAHCHDAEIEAILHENDPLPDARTRQQAAGDDSTSRGTPMDTAMAPLPEQAHVETAEHETRGHEKPESQGQSGNGDEHGQITVLQVEAADRTVGDTTPTGIGLKPTGEQLLEMEGDDNHERRLDRFVGKLVEHADDLRDGSGDIAGALEADSRPVSSGHPGTYQGHFAYEQHPPGGLAVSDATGAIVVAAIAGAAGLSRLRAHLRKDT